MNSKTALLGFLLGLSLGLGVVIASQNFALKGVIVVPSSCSVKLSGLRESALGYYELPQMVLNRNETACQFEMLNQGSKPALIAWTLESSDPALVVQLEGYVEHSSSGDVFASTNSFTLDRGMTCTFRLTIADHGLLPGAAYEFTVTLSASEA